MILQQKQSYNCDIDNCLDNKRVFLLTNAMAIFYKPLDRSFVWSWIYVSHGPMFFNSRFRPELVTNLFNFHKAISLYKMKKFVLHDISLNPLILTTLVGLSF